MTGGSLNRTGSHDEWIHMEKGELGVDPYGEGRTRRSGSIWRREN